MQWVLYFADGNLDMTLFLRFTCNLSYRVKENLRMKASQTVKPLQGLRKLSYVPQKLSQTYSYDITICLFRSTVLAVHLAVAVCWTTSL